MLAVRSLENLDAQGELAQARGVATGIALSMSKKPQVRQAIRALERLAHPTVEI